MYHMILTKRKYTFESCADNEGPDQTADAQSDQGICWPQTESLNMIECFSEEKCPNETLDMCRMM